MQFFTFTSSYVSRKVFLFHPPPAAFRLSLGIRQCSLQMSGVRASREIILLEETNLSISLNLEEHDVAKLLAQILQNKPLCNEQILFFV